MSSEYRALEAPENKYTLEALIPGACKCHRANVSPQKITKRFGCSEWHCIHKGRDEKEANGSSSCSHVDVDADIEQKIEGETRVLK